MLTEVWKSTEQVVRERLSSAVIFPFALSWAFWNYKFLVYLFSDIGVPRVFSLIDEQLYSSTFSKLLSWGLLPLLTTALLIFVLPKVERWVLEITLPTQQTILDLKAQHANSQRLTVEQSRRLYAEMTTQQQESGREQERLRQTAERLEAELATIRLRANELESEREMNPMNLATSERVLLQKMVERPPGRPALESDLLPFNRDDLASLFAAGLIRQERDFVESAPAYVVTRAGIALLRGRDSQHRIDSDEMDVTALIRSGSLNPVLEALAASGVTSADHLGMAANWNGGPDPASLISALERQGYLMSEGHGRSLSYRLTEKGVELANQLGVHRAG